MSLTARKVCQKICIVNGSLDYPTLEVRRSVKLMEITNLVQNNYVWIDNKHINNYLKDIIP